MPISRFSLLEMHIVSRLVNNPSFCNTINPFSIDLMVFLCDDSKSMRLSILSPSDISSIDNVWILNRPFEFFSFLLNDFLPFLHLCLEFPHLFIELIFPENLHLSLLLFFHFLVNFHLDFLLNFLFLYEAFSYWISF